MKKNITLQRHQGFRARRNTDILNRRRAVGRKKLCPLFVKKRM